MTDQAHETVLRRYAAYAPTYDRQWAAYTQATLRHAAEAIRLNGAAQMIDVACGTGALAEMLIREHPGLRITGVDMSKDMLEVARRRIPPGTVSGVRWLEGSAEKLPVESNQFDVLTCTNAFHLVPDETAALREFHRVLKPKAALVIVDWCMDFLSMKLLAMLLPLRDRHERHIRTLDELAALIEQAGFMIATRQRFRGPKLWGMMSITARKP